MKTTTIYRETLIITTDDDGARTITRHEYADTVFSMDDFCCTAAQPERFEVRQIDALMYDDCWVWNESHYMGGFCTYSDDIPRAFRHYLKQYHGITFYKGRTVTEYDGDVYEICDRATHEPLFAAIPQEA